MVYIFMLARHSRGIYNPRIWEAEVEDGGLKSRLGKTLSQKLEGKCQVQAQ